MQQSQDHTPLHLSADVRVASTAEYESVASAAQYFSCRQIKSLLQWHADLRNEGSNSPTSTRAPENGGRKSEFRTET